MILESNDDIKNLVSYLDGRVLKLRNLYPNTKFLEITKKFYDNVVIPWSDECYLYENEPEIEDDEEIKNQILDMINLIDDVLNSQIKLYEKTRIKTANKRMYN
jgi:hypothetical protein